MISNAETICARCEDEKRRENLKDEIEIKRKKALRGGKSGSRRLSGSAGTAPRRRAFSSLMLFRDLFPHFAFSGPLLINRVCFVSSSRSSARLLGLPIDPVYPRGVCLSAAPEREARGRPCGTAARTALPPHLFKTSTRLDLISEFSAFFLVFSEQEILKRIQHYKFFIIC